MNIDSFYRKFEEAFEKIKKANNILLVPHTKPDGDALSSVCALLEFLSGLNKNYFAYCYDKPLHQFNFLPHIEKIKYHKEDLFFSQYDLIITLDCGSLSRTKLENELLNRSKNQYVIEFDHHPKIDDFGDLEIRIPAASSTAEVLYHFFKINKIRFNKNIANCILTGILTDTGNFLFPNTSDETINIGSEMLIYGARFPTILENIKRNKTLSGMKLWGQALNNLKINNKYNIAYSILTYDDISSSQANDEELEGISNFLSNLHGVKCLMLLIEAEKGKIKGSLRTSFPNVDVSKLAKFLGGGGHEKASGFVINGRLKKTSNSWQII